MLTVSVTPEMSTPCDPAFLVEIIFDLGCIFLVVSRNEKRLSVATANVVTKTISKELARLQAHPQLFPNGRIMEDFFQFTSGSSRMVEATITNLENAQGLIGAWFEGIVASTKERYRPSFDASREPWQQFLHSGAPGSGTLPKNLQYGALTQIIPPGGIKILQAWQEENAITATDIGVVSKLSSIATLIGPISSIVGYLHS